MLKDCQSLLFEEYKTKYLPQLSGICDDRVQSVVNSHTRDYESLKNSLFEMKGLFLIYSCFVLVFSFPVVSCCLSNDFSFLPRSFIGFLPTPILLLNSLSFSLSICL